MILSSQEASNQRSWLLRIWEGWFPQDFYKCIWLFNIGLIILLLGISVEAFLASYIPFFLAMIMAVTGAVFALLVVIFTLYEARQNSASSFTLESSYLRNTQRDRNLDFEMDVWEAGTKL